MYIPKHFEMCSEHIQQFIKQHSFANVISADLQASHIPLIFEPGHGNKGLLYGHLAKANKQWQQFGDQQVLAIFNGEHSYISPTWYQTTPAVPTWNYAAVHCYGKAKLLPDEQLASLLNNMVKQYEPELLNDELLMPEAYLAKLKHAIVGFVIEITDIQAKQKLGQHKSSTEQQAIFTALQQSNQLNSKQLADYMMQTQVGIGK